MFQKILNIGADKKLSKREKRAVRVSNFIIFFLGINQFVTFLVRFVFKGDFQLIEQVLLIESVLYLSILWFNYKRYYVAARFLVLFAFALVTFLHSNFLVTQQYTEYYYLVIALASLFFFNEAWINYSYLIASILLFYVPNLYYQIYPKENFGFFHALPFFIGVFHVVLYFRNENERNEKSLEKAYNQLEISNKYELGHMELKHLRSQMNPHFVFNSLNNVEGLIVEDKKGEAYRYLAHFSNLLRQTLEVAEDFLIPLSKELEFIENYLEIEKMRLNNLLEYKVVVANIDDVNSVKIPPMLIQPLVENAIKHGLFHKKGNKKLKITFAQDAACLLCIVQDNGIGRVKSKEFQNHKKHLHASTNNIQNQIERFNKLYNLKLDLIYEDLYENQQATGTKVVVRLNCTD